MELTCKHYKHGYKDKTRLQLTHLVFRSEFTKNSVSYTVLIKTVRYVGVNGLD